jgi:signal transduction histidine kinase
MISVRDHGIGISAEHLGRLFQRYQRAVSAQNFGGLGLGLYIVRVIVEAHGGTVHAESRIGEGATFVVELPGVEAAGPSRTDLPKT